jgi:hypothetical protein
MCRVDIYCVDPKNIIIVVVSEDQRIYEAALVKIKTIYFVSRRREEGIAGREVVC